MAFNYSPFLLISIGEFRFSDIFLKHKFRLLKVIEHKTALSKKLSPAILSDIDHLLHFLITNRIHIVSTVQIVYKH